MANTIFGRLNYNYSGSGISDLSSNATSFMNTVPSFLEDWQIKDIADNNVGGYKQNPVASSSQSIRNTCNTLVTLLSSSTTTEGANTIYYSALQGTSSAITNLFTSMNSLSANIGGTNGGLFIEHTNRISGAISIEQSMLTNDNAANLPHYDTALNNGQTIMYLTHQADGVSNNAPIMGCFTSLLEKDTINSLNTTISSYYNTINSSITISPGTYDPEANSITYTRTSSLSQNVVSSMQTNINTINSTMASRRSHDEQFYQNSKTVISEMNTLRSYSDMGQTANTLCQNYVGTTKLLSRINS